ncbi:unnamed protein product, partial [Effrenium voratum]
SPSPQRKKEQRNDRGDPFFWGSMGQSDPRLGEHPEVGIFCPVFHHRFAHVLKGAADGAQELMNTTATVFYMLRDSPAWLGTPESLEMLVALTVKHLAAVRWPSAEALFPLHPTAASSPFPRLRPESVQSSLHKFVVDRLNELEIWTGMQKLDQVPRLVEPIDGYIDEIQTAALLGLCILVLAGDVARLDPSQLPAFARPFVTSDEALDLHFEHPNHCYMLAWRYDSDLSWSARVLARGFKIDQRWASSLAEDTGHATHSGPFARARFLTTNRWAAETAPWNQLRAAGLDRPAKFHVCKRRWTPFTRASCPTSASTWQREPVRSDGDDTAVAGHLLGARCLQGLLRLRGLAVPAPRLAFAAAPRAAGGHLRGLLVAAGGCKLGHGLAWHPRGLWEPGGAHDVSAGPAESHGGALQPLPGQRLDGRPAGGGRGGAVFDRCGHLRGHAQRAAEGEAVAGAWRCRAVRGRYRHTVPDRSIGGLGPFSRGEQGQSFLRLSTRSMAVLIRVDERWQNRSERRIRVPFE